MVRLFAVIALLWAGSFDAAAQVYDLKTDWSDTVNPNGAWSYNVGNTVLPRVADWAPATAPGAQPAWAAAPAGRGHIPVWFRSVDRWTGIEPGDIVGHTDDPFNGAGRGEANVTWTSPAAGIADISLAVWYAANPGRSGIWTLFLNSTVLASGTLRDGGPYTRANPATFTAAGVAVKPRDLLKLMWVRSSLAGPMMGVDWRIDLRAEGGGSAPPPQPPPQTPPQPTPTAPSWQLNPTPALVGSAARFTAPVAPDSIASAFGSDFASGNFNAALDPAGNLPLELGGTTVEVNGVRARLFYVSAKQVNFLVPLETKPGVAEVVVRSETLRRISRGFTRVEDIAPAIFVQDTRNTGAILNAVTYRPGPFDAETPELPVSDRRTRLAIFCTGVRAWTGSRPIRTLARAGAMSASPMLAGVNLPFRAADREASALSPRRASLDNIRAEVRDGRGELWLLPVEYAGPAPGYPGLDQVNVVLPAAAPWSGALNLELWFGDTASNQVRLEMRPAAGQTCPAVQPCGDLSGPWRISEEAVLRCTFSDGQESDTETFRMSGTATKSFTKTGPCTYSWDLPLSGQGTVYNLGRNAEVSGNSVTVTGPLGDVAGAGSISKNEMRATGQVCGDVLNLAGTGELNGSFPVPEENVTVSFQCAATLSSQAQRGRIHVSAIHSGQFPGTDANYRTDSVSASGASPARYVFMGPDAEGKASARATVTGAEQFPPGLVKVRFALVDGSGIHPLGDGRLQGQTATLSASIRPSLYPEDYHVVAWLDTDDNGQVDPGEQYSLGIHWFRIVGGAAYHSSWALGRMAVAALRSKYPQSIAMLEAFLEDKHPALDGMAPPAEISVAEAARRQLRLSHHVGARLKTPGDGVIRSYTFSSQSGLATSLLRSRTLSDHLEREVAKHRSEIVAQLGAPGTARSFRWALADQWITVGAFCEDAFWIPACDDFDLKGALGEARLTSATLSLEAQRTDAGVRISSARFQGAVYDLYDWDYEKLLDRTFAVLQAGWTTLGNAGHVFALEINLDGAVDLSGVRLE